MNRSCPRPAQRINQQRDRIAELERLLSATNEQLNSEESGYVIERYINGELRYWEGRYVDDRAFITNASDAVRFARESDGAVVLAWLLGGHGRITQHVWRLAKGEVRQ